MVTAARPLRSWDGSHHLCSKHCYTRTATLTNHTHSTPITFLGNTVHSLATKFHLIPLGATDIEAAGYSQVPGGARAEAERRR